MVAEDDSDCHGKAYQKPLGPLDNPHGRGISSRQCHRRFIWPKVFWDFMTKNLNGAVKPIPVLQILNLLMGLLGLAWEWPLKYFAGTLPHRSIEFRLILYPLSALLSMLLYQGTDPAIYYLVGIGVYFWAYSEGE
ncbi:protein PRO41, partial [Aspergillus arachidicola]